jgi:DNA polymerase III alpha subunit (gram-positive type)
MIEDTYISVDVETTGKIPSCHKMLSIGLMPIINGVVDKSNGRQWFINEINLDLAEKGGVMPYWDKDTYKWWFEQNRSGWNVLAKGIREQGKHPQDVMSELTQWVMTLPGTKIFVADPATFDAGFIWEYIFRWVGQHAIDNIGRMRMVDIRTMRMMKYGVSYSKANRTLVPDEVTAGSAITHDALDDAYFQALQFVYLMKG